MSLVDVKNLSVKRGERQVLESVGLTVEAGQMVGLIGPNGAGKSTLLKAILGTLKAESGSIKLLGKKSRDIPAVERARTLAYLPQEREIYWPLSVERIVALGRLPHLQPWQKPQPSDDEAIHKAMVQTDVMDLAERPVNELAGGEKTLAMLARVLAVEPMIILADEPVTGLDPNHQIQVMQLLKDVADSGKGVLVVLHDLSLAARFCHQLCLIHEGKVLATGSANEVLSKENLKASYHIEAKYGQSEDQFYVVPWKRI